MGWGHRDPTPEKEEEIVNCLGIVYVGGNITPELRAAARRAWGENQQRSFRSDKKEKKKMKLTLLIEGESSAELIAVLEKLEGGEAAAQTTPAKTGKGKKAATAETSEEPDPFAAGGGETDEAPKLTIQDVQKAGGAYMKAHGRDKVMKVLKKFGVNNAKDLSPDQYADALEAFGG